MSPLLEQAAVGLLGQLELTAIAAVYATHDSIWKRKPSLFLLVIPAQKHFPKP